MKIRLRSVLCFVAVALGLGACQGPTTPTAGGRGMTITVGEADVGGAVRLRVGDMLVVRLAGNATTGYGWQLAGTVGAGLAPVGKQPEYVADPAAAGVVVSGGHDFFRFEARRPGQETLRFAYVRPWEPQRVAQRAKFRVVVR